jgi:hypothetical protein
MPDEMDGRICLQLTAAHKIRLRGMPARRESFYCVRWCQIFVKAKPIIWQGWNCLFFPNMVYILLSRDSVKKFMPKEKADTSPSSTPYPRT